MKQLTSFFLLSLFILSIVPFLAQDVEAAAGIRLPSVEARTFFFEPNAEYEWTWNIFGDSQLSAEIGGTLEQYAYLNDPNPGGGPRDVTFGLRLPPDLEPGRHTLLLYAQESRPDAVIGGVARVGGRITIISLYPTPYLDAELDVLDTSVSNNTQATVRLTSWSEVPVTAFAEIRIYDFNDTLVHTQQTSPVTITSQQRETIRVSHLQTNNLEPGRYRAVAHIRGAQNNLTAQDRFLIGTFDVSLVSHTTQLRPDAVNRFEFRAESNWNEDIQGAHGIVYLLNRTEQTPSRPIRAGLQSDFSTFIDLSGVEQEGPVDGLLEIYFGEGESREFPITVNLTYGVDAVTESPGMISFQLNQLTILYVALLLLVAINVLLLFRKKKE